MSVKKNRVNWTVTLLLAFLALIIGIFVSQQVSRKKAIDRTQCHGTCLAEPRAIHPFSLTRTDDKPFTPQSVQGKWTLLFFGFTNCGSICPTTMAELGKMYRLLEEKNLKTMPEVVMISIDPERDSLEKLQHYVRAFDPHFYGARGDSESIRKMTRELGIAYAKIAVKNSGESHHYDMQHSGAVILLDPQGRLSAFFTSPLQAEFLAQDYQLLIS